MRSWWLRTAYGSKSAQLFHLGSKTLLVNVHSNTDTDVQILIALRECQIYDQEVEILHAYYFTTYQWENTRELGQLKIGTF